MNVVIIQLYLHYFSDLENYITICEITPVLSYCIFLLRHPEVAPRIPEHGVSQVNEVGGIFVTKISAIISGGSYLFILKDRGKDLKKD